MLRHCVEIELALGLMAGMMMIGPAYATDWWVINHPDYNASCERADESPAHAVESWREYNTADIEDKGNEVDVVIQTHDGRGLTEYFFRGAQACHDTLRTRQQQKLNAAAAAKAKLDPYS